MVWGCERVLEGAEVVTTEEVDPDEAEDEADCEEADSLADSLDSEAEDAEELDEEAGAEDDEEPPPEDPPPELGKGGRSCEQKLFSSHTRKKNETHHSPVPTAIVVGELFPNCPSASVM